MATEAHHFPDWDSGPVKFSWGKRLTLFGGLVAPLVILAVLLSIPTGIDPKAFVTVAIIWVLLLAREWWMVERRLLRRAAARPLEDPRFTNIVEGLATQTGMRMPHLFVSDEGGPNAFVIRRRGPSIVIRSSLLDTFTRTEQEAVAAHCLVRLNSSLFFFSYLAALLGRNGSRFAPKVGYQDDIHTAAMTRYPPALAAAIEKAKPVDDPSAPLWFVAHGPSHRPPSERIAALQDL